MKTSTDEKPDLTNRLGVWVVSASSSLELWQEGNEYRAEYWKQVRTVNKGWSRQPTIVRHRDFRIAINGAIYHSDCNRGELWQRILTTLQKPPSRFRNAHIVGLHG